ncbi:acidic mammalian chitinase-like isoform X2 [Artemia franciscana]|uniref:acidic mammalian chitinase-like isoform X2 n=1 Tax=Artemia franciscana TaxID=6661 RepID=UPI0032DBEA97
MTAKILLLFLVAAFATITLTEGKRNVVCYYGSWAVYRPGDGKFDVEDIDPFVCTHLIFGFAGLKEYDNSIYALDPYNELYENWGRGAYERFTGLKKINPELVTILAIGGWNEGSVKYSKMASTAEGRRQFIDSVVPFLLRYGFDGLDMDWEYPTQRGGVAEDRDNFISLLRELKAAFAPEGLVLTAAVSAGEQTIDEAYEIPIVSELLDMINLMTYDYHGAWETITGHNAPMYAHPLDDGNVTNFNVNFSLNHWLTNGADPAKIQLGMGFYGRGWSLNNIEDNGPYAPANQPIQAGPYTRQAGIWGYNEVCEQFLADPAGWTVVRDEYYQSPYAYNGRNWIGYDDMESLTKKMELIIIALHI